MSCCRGSGWLSDRASRDVGSSSASYTAEALLDDAMHLYSDPHSTTHKLQQHTSGDAELDVLMRDTTIEPSRVSRLILSRCQHKQGLVRTKTKQHEDATSASRHPPRFPVKISYRSIGRTFLAKGPALQAVARVRCALF